MKHEETCELNIKDPANENVDSVSFHIINWGKDNPGFFTDTFSIEGLNNSVGVLFTNPKRASSTKAKLTNFKWIDATKYKARVTWGSPDNQSTVTLDFIEVRQSRFEKTK